jgi:hypothetical protein
MTDVSVCLCVCVQLLGDGVMALVWFPLSLTAFLVNVRGERSTVLFAEEKAKRLGCFLKCLV